MRPSPGPETKKPLRGKGFLNEVGGEGLEPPTPSV